MSLKGKSQTKILAAMMGFNGNIPISGTNPKIVKCLAFEATAVSTIASVKDSKGVERIEDIEWDGTDLAIGDRCYFGFEASEVTLASGKGVLYRTEPPFAE